MRAEAEAQARAAVRESETDDEFTDPDEKLESAEEPI